jgi:hypothetical protein
MQSDAAKAAPLMRGVMWQVLGSNRQFDLAIKQTPKLSVPVPQYCPSETLMPLLYFVSSGHFVLLYALL